jgi:ABC-2 type transport system permease protein
VRLAWVIMKKEWLELKNQRGLVLSLLFLPAMLTAPAVLAGNQAVAGQDPIRAIQSFSTLLLMLPVILPSILAAHSIIGEKAKKTLEPLLATPIRTSELLLGKCLAALLPAVLITWTCALVIVASFSAGSFFGTLWLMLSSASWAISLGVCAPLLSLIMISVIVVLSSRVSDPRTAQQLSALVMLPLSALIVATGSGALVLGPAIAIAAAAVLAVLAALVLAAAVRLFDRERILTRWAA